MLKKISRLFFSFLIITGLALSSSVALAAPPVQSESNVVEIVSSNDQLTQFNTFLQQAGLAEELTGEGPFTVFAPSDAAFEAVPAAMQNTFLTDEGTLREVLQYHVVPGTITADQFTDTESLATLEGTSVNFAMGADGVPMFEEAQMTTTDLMAANGVVHIIDMVVLPPAQQEPQELESSPATIVACSVEYVVQAEDWLSKLAEQHYGDPLMYPAIFGATNEVAAVDDSYDIIEDANVIEIGQKLCIPSQTDAQAIMAGLTEDVASDEGEVMVDEEAVSETAQPDVTEPEGTDMSAKTIYEVIAENDDFETLTSLIAEADLPETLQDVGPFTVFAPTDQAFEAVPQETMEQLRNNPDQLRELLLNHVVQGQEWSADDLASVNELPTVEESIIEISVENNILTVGAANVTTSDIEASNGVIHAIDSVLLPN